MKQLKGFAHHITDTDQSKKVAVIPYVHALSHRLKKTADRFGVKVVFSARNKLGSLCAMVSNRLDSRGDSPPRGCLIKHGLQFVRCMTNVVYCIPMSCGRVYVGQTGRCLNVRLREHHSSLKGKPYTHLAQHCSKCGFQPRCQPLFTDTVVVFKHRDRATRELAEAFHIRIKGPDCRSHPSLSILDKEVQLLKERG